MDDDAKAALQKIAKAVDISDGDSLSSLNPDRMVIWTGSSSWEGAVSITLGDLRALTKQVRHENNVKGQAKMYAALYPGDLLRQKYDQWIAEGLKPGDLTIDAALAELERRGITV